MTKKEAIDRYKRGTKTLLKSYKRKRSKEKDEAEIKKLDVEFMQTVQGLGSIFTKKVRITVDKNGKPHLTF